MPITLSGSTGISGVDGSVSLPSIVGVDTNTGIYFPAADTVAVSVGGTEVMRFSGSGGVSIATTASINGVPYPSDGPLFGMRNKIINGAMEIDQRNGGGSVSINNTAVFPTDRWYVAAIGGAGTGTATAQLVVDAPSGLRNSLKYTVTNAKSPAAGDSFYIYQPIEGNNFNDFAFGTAAAKSVTLSFWVKCSLTGTFSGFLRSYNGTTYRSYVFTYTINSANTWQYVTVTAVGDTVQTPSNDNTQGFGVLFDLGSGSTSQTSTLNQWQTGSYLASTTATKLISTLNATFQVTGVQLEVGSVATPFERRSIGQELALCQRYYQGLNYFKQWGAGGGLNGVTGFTVTYPPMRANPSVTLSGQGYVNCSGLTVESAYTNCMTFYVTASGSGQIAYSSNYTLTSEI